MYGCIILLPAIVKLYRGVQFYWRKSEHSEKTTDLTKHYWKPWRHRHWFQKIKTFSVIKYCTIIGRDKTKNGHHNWDRMTVWLTFIFWNQCSGFPLSMCVKTKMRNFTAFVIIIYMDEVYIYICTLVSRCKYKGIQIYNYATNKYINKYKIWIGRDKTKNGHHNWDRMTVWLTFIFWNQCLCRQGFQ
jgi:hypothetical protein